MALTKTNKKSILKGIANGKNGMVEKTTENEVILSGFVGESIDVNFDFDGSVMYCGTLSEYNNDLTGKSGYMVERDALSNYEAQEGDSDDVATEKAAKLAELQGKETITL